MQAYLQQRVRSTQKYVFEYAGVNQFWWQKNQGMKQGYVKDLIIGWVYVQSKGHSNEINKYKELKGSSISVRWISLSKEKSHPVLSSKYKNCEEEKNIFI